MQEGAAEVVELREKMSWEQEQARREQINLEARGQFPSRAKKTSSSSSQGHSPSADAAGPSRERPASPRGAPRATSSPKRFVGTIPKFQRDRGIGGAGQAQGAVWMERGERNKEPIKAKRAKA